MTLLDRIRSLAHPGAPHADDAPFVRLQNVTARYNGVVALEDIDFELHGGEQVAVVGPNGAGKSTLFKVIAGIHPPSRGTAHMRGSDPRGHICIAYLPQRNEVDWRFPVTVQDVVMMGRVSKMGLFRRPKTAEWRLVDECLRLVDLHELAGRQISELSGGQQQRMFIAQALAQEAELLMMDEPLNGLDAPSQDEVFSILETLKGRGVTVLVAMHDLGLAAQRFDSVLLLNKRLVGYGPPADVFTEAHLRRAYGGHLQMVETPEGTLVLNDTCCDDDTHAH
ncbi:MAG: metal ABC transporter ATP-binding protein [Anaerolineae bacterium]|nr:MAG: metal ABC transporter ATP-binding protein [Anaerolineae bacterium]